MTLLYLILFLTLLPFLSQDSLIDQSLASQESYKGEEKRLHTIECRYDSMDGAIGYFLLIKDAFNNEVLCSMPRVFTGLGSQFHGSDVRFYVVTEGTFACSYQIVHLTSRPRLPSLSRDTVNGSVQMSLGDEVRWNIVRATQQRYFRLSSFAACHLNSAETYLNVSIPLHFLSQQACKAYYTKLAIRMDDFWTRIENDQFTDHQRRVGLQRLREMLPPDIVIPVNEAERLFYMSYGLITMPQSFLPPPPPSSPPPSSLSVHAHTQTPTLPPSARVQTDAATNTDPPPPPSPLFPLSLPPDPTPVQGAAFTDVNHLYPFSLDSALEPPFIPLPSHLSSDPSTSQPSTSQTSTCKPVRKRTMDFSLNPKPFLRVKEAEHECVICDSLFTSDEDLRKHFLSHLENANARDCFVCLAHFEDSKHMVDHFCDDHGNLPKFQCVYCPKKYYLRSALDRHMQSKHAFETVHIDE